MLRDKGIRVEVDARNEKLGYKIREARNERVPYILVVGDKEMETNSVSARNRKAGDIGSITNEEITERIMKENAERVIW